MALRRRVTTAIVVLLASGAFAWHTGLPKWRERNPSSSHHQVARRFAQPIENKRMGPRGAAHGERRWGTYCGESRVGDRREILSLRGFASSTSDTMEQEPAAGNDGTGDNSNENNIEEPRPFAKVGDVVQFMGKWKGEVVFGEIRQLQRVDRTGEWRAYVLELEEIGEGQYARKKNRKSKAENLATLRPVRAFYVRSVDGFKVMTNSETGAPRYISEGYELEGFELPKIVVDPVKFASDLESYEDLKRRLVLDAASFGAVSAVVAWQASIGAVTYPMYLKFTDSGKRRLPAFTLASRSPKWLDGKGTSGATVITDNIQVRNLLAPLNPQVFGVDRAVLVALGALAAVAYVILLEKTADDVASGKRDTVTKLQGDVRFAIPVALVGAVALRNYLSHPETTGLLNLIPKEDYAAVIFGFVAPSRLPLLYREIRSSLKGDELLDILPGSLGQGRQILKRMGGPSAGAGVTDDNKIGSGSTRILVVSGPKCLGKSTLVEAIMREDDRLAAPAWCTTRPMKQAENDEQDYVQIGQVKFEDIERNAGFLHTYHDEAGESYGLRLEDVLAIAKKGKVCVIDADRPLVKALMGVPDVALIGVWVSLDSIEAIENRVRSMLIERGAKEGEELESNVRAMTRQAVADIEFGVTSGVFDFTVINNSDVHESTETLRRAVEFAAA